MILSPKIINGQALADESLLKILKRFKHCSERPGLAVILVGDDPASHIYVKRKQQACEKCGLLFHRYLFNAHAPEKEILECLKFLNNDPETTGIIVQLPLPAHLDTNKIITAISCEKDVDGLRAKKTGFSPLSAAIQELIKTTKEKVENKKIVILENQSFLSDSLKNIWGGSNTVVSVKLKEKNWKTKIKSADILIVAVGQPKLITADLIKKDVIIIDVGINRLKNKKVVGDVDLKSVLPKVKFISPVPGGVGPMTVAMLLKSLINLKEQQG